MTQRPAWPCDRSRSPAVVSRTSFQFVAFLPIASACVRPDAGARLVECKTRGPQRCARANAKMAVLVPEPQLLDDLAVSVDVRPLHVVEQAATGSDHLQQPSAAVMVLLVRPKVLGEVVDPLREKRDLDSCGSGVRLVCPVLLERRCVVEGHVVCTVPAKPAV